jgi:excisionase family DNA binding protein
MKIVMKVSEVAQLLGVSDDSIYRAVRLGQLPHRRLGRRIVFHRPTIEAWLTNGGVVVIAGNN